MRKKVGWLFIFFFLCFLTWGSQKLSRYVISSSSLFGKKTESRIKIIVDAGHGGMDGGKIGVNDAKESDINLKIAKLLQEDLEKKQFQVTMTREGADGMADSNVEDLKARVTKINQEKPELVVSIHQNSYGDASVKGAQVFYFEHSDESEKAAKLIQKSMNEMDTDNHREAKANTTYYLLKRTEVPVVIVECGFLSNSEEADKLVTQEYQEKVAQAIVEGLYRYFGIQEK